MTIRRKSLFLFIFLWLIIFLLLLISSVFPAVIPFEPLAMSQGFIRAFEAPNIMAMNAAIFSMITERKRPVATGTFFALGYSGGMILWGIGLLILPLSLVRQINIGLNLFGCVVCAYFLYTASWRIMNRSYPCEGKRLHIKASREMVLVGILFSLLLPPTGLLDTLSLTATVQAMHLPLWSLLMLAAFAAVSMALACSVNSSIMTGFYWEARTHTGTRLLSQVSQFLTGTLAFCVGTYELTTAFLVILGFHGGKADWYLRLREHDVFGFTILISFIGIWALSTGKRSGFLKRKKVASPS